MKNSILFTLFFLIITLQFLLAQAPDTLWTKTYGEGVGNCVIETSDGGLVVVGKKNVDVYLLKTNSMGDSLWSKAFGDTNYEDVGNSVRQTSDDGFIIVGTTLHGVSQILP